MLGPYGLEVYLTIRDSRFLDHSRRFHRLRVPRNDRLWVECGVELAE